MLTRQILTTVLLTLAIGGTTSAHGTEQNVAHTGLADMAVTHEAAPGVARTGLGDMSHGGSSRWVASMTRAAPRRTRARSCRSQSKGISAVIRVP
jgi:hypothetical protein